jgi:glutamate--cysteine ligase catalytic subunit
MWFLGVDHTLARHLAHLFIRDPLVVYRESLQTSNDDTESLGFFEVKKIE